MKIKPKSNTYDALTWTGFNHAEMKAFGAAKVALDKHGCTVMTRQGDMVDLLPGDVVVKFMSDRLHVVPKDEAAALYEDVTPDPTADAKRERALKALEKARAAKAAKAQQQAVAA